MSFVWNLTFLLDIYINKPPQAMCTSKIHFVSKENDTLFIHGKKTTVCGKKYDEVGDFTSMTEFVTCKKCKNKTH